MATRMATGVGKGDAGFEHGRTAAQAAVDEVGAPPHLVLVFASPRHDHGEVLKGVRSVTGEAPLIGCSSAGEFTEQDVVSESVVVTVVSSDTMCFTVGRGRGLKEHLSRAVTEAVSDFRGSLPISLKAGLVHRTILLFTDALVGGGEALIDELMVQTALQYELAGGAAGDDAQFKSTPVFYQAEVLTDAFVCAEVLSTTPLGLGISHGWSPIGPKMRVTRSDGAIVQEINGRPALEVYRDFAREQGVTLEGKNVVPFLMEHIIGWLDQEGDEKLRVTLWPLEDGSVVCASEIPQGALITLMKATDQSVMETAAHAARQGIERLQVAHPAGMIALECVSQRLRIGDAGVANALHQVQDVIGRVPVGGCHGYGQLVRTERAFTGLMSASALAVVFPNV